MTSKLRGAFVGFGNIAELGHWPSYTQSPDTEIVAIMDMSAARQQVARALQSNLRTYSSAEDLFQHEKLDFVDICTPPATHAALSLQALEQGCHVLCEKPLTLKPSEYLELAAAMRQSGKTVFTVHNWKFAPIFQKSFSLIREGKIGTVWHVEIFTLRNNICQGTMSAAQSTDWRNNAAIAGGGILVDHGWHSFYLLLNLVGAEPQKILAKMLKDREDLESLEEAVQALVQFPEASGYVHLTWRAQLRRNNVIVQGTLGTLILDDDRLLFTTHEGHREEMRFDTALSAGSHHADWFEPLLMDFVVEMNDAIKRGTNFKEAGWCLALTSAAYQSNLQGFQEVSVFLPGHEKVLL